MIRSKDLNFEIKQIELKLEKDGIKGTDDILQAMLKVQMLILKVVRDIKTNQVTIMRKQYGNEIFVKPQAPRSGDGTKQVRTEKK